MEFDWNDLTIVPGDLQSYLFPCPYFYSWNRYPSHWQNYCIGSWIGRVRDVMRRGVKWKALSTKVISQKQYCSPWGIEEINGIIKAFKDTRW